MLLVITKDQFAERRPRNKNPIKIAESLSVFNTPEERAQSIRRLQHNRGKNRSHKTKGKERA
jgi:hypothetical protein